MCELSQGFRGTLGIKGEPRLVSAYKAIWQPYQQLEAEHHPNVNSIEEKAPVPCQSSPCKAWSPGIYYGCGIYGVKTAAFLKQHLRDRLFDDSAVVGQVYLWGRIIEHERGYRAQYAYPKCIVYAQKSAALLAQTYGIPYKEDLSWTSEIRSELSMPNHYYYPSPSSFPLPTQQFTMNQLLSNLLSPSSHYPNQSLSPWESKGSERSPVDTTV